MSSIRTNFKLPTVDDMYDHSGRCINFGKHKLLEKSLFKGLFNSA